LHCSNYNLILLSKTFTYAVNCLRFKMRTVQFLIIYVSCSSVLLRIDYRKRCPKHYGEKKTATEGFHTL
jgi:hypothetical protein